MLYRHSSQPGFPLFFYHTPPYYAGTHFWRDGRFITEDPAKDGANWYTYCANNPLRFVDPSGLIYYDPDKGWVSSTTPENNPTTPSTNNGNSSGSGSSSGGSSPDPMEEQLRNIADRFASEMKKLNTLIDTDVAARALIEQKDLFKDAGDTKTYDYLTSLANNPEGMAQLISELNDVNVYMGVPSTEIQNVASGLGVNAPNPPDGVGFGKTVVLASTYSANMPQEDAAFLGHEGTVHVTQSLARGGATEFIDDYKNEMQGNPANYLTHKNELPAYAFGGGIRQMAQSPDFVNAFNNAYQVDLSRNTYVQVFMRPQYDLRRTTP